MGKGAWGGVLQAVRGMWGGWEHRMGAHGEGVGQGWQRTGAWAATALRGQLLLA